MKVFEALVFLFKGLLFLDGHLTHDLESHADAAGCARGAGGCG